jgi:hypothetical protein
MFTYGSMSFLALDSDGVNPRYVRWGGVGTATYVFLHSSRSSDSTDLLADHLTIESMMQGVKRKLCSNFGDRIYPSGYKGNHFTHPHVALH